MTVVWQEGFEVANTQVDLGRKYAAVVGTVNTATGRAFGTALASDAVGIELTTKVLQQSAEAICIVGIAHETFDPDASDLVDVLNLGGTHQIKLKCVPDTATTYRLEVESNTVQLALSAPISIGWNYIEFKTLLSATVGTVEVLLNGVQIINVNGVNTAATGVPEWDAIKFGIKDTGVGNSTSNLDDIYILNGSGSIRNDFLGPIVIERSLPIGDGSASEWTPDGGGSNFSEVDEVPADDDLTFVESAGVGDKDLYSFAPLAFIEGGILGVQMNTVGRLTIAGSRAYAHVFKDGALGTEDEGDAVALTSTVYDSKHEIWEQNPESGADFTPSDIAVGEFGYNTKI